MATRVLELELTNKLMPIRVEKGYEKCRILVRFHKHPIGWVSFDTIKNNCIQTDELDKQIKKQVGSNLVLQSFSNYLNKEDEHILNLQPITVVVCTRNRTKQLAECLHSLLAIEYDNYEIIVVDNASNNEESYYLVKNLPVRYVREDRPGLNWARNRGIAEASHSIIAFTDDDVQVDRFWLQAIGKSFVNPDVMATTGFVAPKELETQAQVLFELGYGGMSHGFKQRRVHRDTLTPRQQLWASNFGVGANMAFRQDVFKRIGSFDVALDVGTPSRGAGDIEMFHRLVTQSNLLMYEPSMLVWHTHREDRSALSKQIADNGCSFGCYLIHCYRHRTVKRSSIIAFFLIDWFFKWNMKNLLKPSPKVPRLFSAIELMEILKSPIAYKKSQAQALKIKAGNAIEG